MGRPIEPDSMSRRTLFSWTLRVLQSHGLKPRRRLSQNFIVDPALLKGFTRNVEYLDTFEIGCGIGTLTMSLSRFVPRLICVEIDWRLLEAAVENIDAANVVLVNADATVYTPPSKQVVGNIPYHITSEILTGVARLNTVTRAVFTVQRDVAERITAAPGDRRYGRITILLNALFEIKVAGTYGSSSFYPEPGVEHSIIVMVRRAPFNRDVEALEALTRAVFTQRRRIALRVLERVLGVREDSPVHSYASRLLGGKRVYEVGWEVYLELARALREAGLL
ncbi:ribosomal RNA small subunit methyltransferase A [Desulfurococcus mucosus]|uniref:Ribosomal RNA adenine methylase transferase n=1 Tax=Desulfurococcus mucosus (strain ATCC 35584 / DSM 2162 / JCM 9187 / O7/1) TaxID=765177 RepID=E8RAD9_DESM0|nr:rRNA adenine dimethyltransferase family protein [Desulfurococcus mucosus]ADV64349.1 ribosomal RNA adenine methylase transferase [Desulfurococcus mucosus DSM 2162]